MYALNDKIKSSLSLTALYSLVYILSLNLSNIAGRSSIIQCFQIQRKACIDKVDEQSVIVMTLDNGIRPNACKDPLAGTIFETPWPTVSLPVSKKDVHDCVTVNRIRSGEMAIQSISLLDVDW